MQVPPCTPCAFHLSGHIETMSTTRLQPGVEQNRALDRRPPDPHLEIRQLSTDKEEPKLLVGISAKENVCSCQTPSTQTSVVSMY